MKCTKCGTPLAGRSSHGLCAVCLFEAMLEPAEAGASAELEGPGTIIGRYKLLERIGEGGFGTVYVAQQSEPVQRRVALKVLKPGMDTRQVIARFEAERQALALMDHPNIARVLDAGATEAGRPFFVMELVAGQKLTDYCRIHQLPLAQRLELFIRVCHAVQHAHHKGIIHRDLKPSNILVTEHEGTAIPKVIDFGIAKAIEEAEAGAGGLTSLNQFLGTPAYMSPEQVGFGGQDIDTRSDVYSLGIILYELVAGHPPFDPNQLAKAGLEEMRRIIREVDPPRPSTAILKGLNPARLPTVRPAMRAGLAAVRGDLDWVVMKCLEKDRARRYETVNGLAMDIRRHLSDEPVVARPPTGFYRLQKVVRRHRMTFVTTGLVSIALVGGVIASTFQALRARRAEREQARLRQLAETEATESRYRLIRRYVAEANRLSEHNQAETALPWMLAALDLESGDPQRQRDERLRIAQTLRGAPKLRWQDFQGRSVDCVAFSPDGAFLATGSDDGQVRIADIGRGCNTITNLALPAAVGCVGFSRQGERVIAMDMLGRARVWNAGTGAPLTPLLQVQGFDRRSIADVARRLKPTAAFNADGTLLLLSWGSRSAELRDAAGGKILRTFSHTDVVYHAVFSPDYRYVATSSKDGTAQVWDAVTGERAGPALKHNGMVDWSQFSADGNRLLTVRERHWVQVWDWRSGARVGRPIYRHSAIFEACLSPDDAMVLTVTWSGYADLYDAATGRHLARLSHPGGLVGARFSPNGRYLATACDDGNVWLWNPGEPNSPPTVLPEGNHIEQLAFSGDSRFLAAGCRGGHARVWEMAPPPQGIRRLPGNDVEWVQFDNSGQRVVMVNTGTKSGIGVYAVPGGTLVNSIALSANQVTQVCFSPEGRRILAFGHAPAVLVLDSTSGRQIVPPLDSGAGVRDALWTPDGKYIVTAAGSAGARAWDAGTGKSTVVFPHSDAVVAIAVAPSGQCVATAEADQTVRTWRTLTAEPISAEWKMPGTVHRLAFSPDGRILAVSMACGTEGVVELHDLASGGLIGKPLVHRDSVSEFAFSPNGRWLATGCDDHSARVWEVLSGKPVTPWLPHGFEVREVAFSPDGTRLATLTRRGAARIWNAGTGEPITAPLLFPRNTGDGHVCFSPDGQQLLLSRGGNEAWLLELQPAAASLPELRSLAETLSCTRFDPVSGMVPLGENELESAWRQLRAFQAASK